MTRRAAREARLAATGEVPPSPSEAPDAPPAFGSGPFTASAFVAPAPGGRGGEEAPGEAPAALGIVGPDGQVLSRRRLREQRTQAIAIITLDPEAVDPPETGTPTESESGRDAPIPSAEATEAENAAKAESASESPEDAVVPAEDLGEPASEPGEPDIVSEPEPEPDAAPADAEAAAAALTDTTPTAPAPEPAPWTAPEGHWTRQLAESEDSGDLTGSHDAGGSPQATSSTIVVDHPAVMDLGGPLDATSEVLLTGSIPLSHDFARTGAMGSVTGAELDDRFDEGFAASPDAQPVRASAVASQHALGSPIVANATRRGGRGMTVLLVTASVLAVLVTGLVVTAIVLGWFGH